MSTVEKMSLNVMSVNFLPNRELRNYKEGKPMGIFEHRGYKENKCFIGCIKEYISQWNGLRVLCSKRLIIDTKKSYRWASIDTMKKWVKKTFADNDVIAFSTYNFWAVKRTVINIDEIILYLFIFYK